ncbi:unnamed protein product [Bursaphelenchus okinawaensis]|uniref:Uncharacterized protein n=1 Tax=Bursaphelenchus okinawaensis TaxID=465554 RepID=A0A811JSE1_9BILA|nr:unnamed protein product [Bursaphelenchus okinawaensis]CAG9080386.1 unnamed protein product [Bursaphelenchus okinawaensis]
MGDRTEPTGGLELSPTVPSEEKPKQDEVTQKSDESKTQPDVSKRQKKPKPESDGLKTAKEGSKRQVKESEEAKAPAESPKEESEGSKTPATTTKNQEVLEPELDLLKKLPEEPKKEPETPRKQLDIAKSQYLISEKQSSTSPGPSSSFTSPIQAETSPGASSSFTSPKQFETSPGPSLTSVKQPAPSPRPTSPSVKPTSPGRSSTSPKSSPTTPALTKASAITAEEFSMGSECSTGRTDTRASSQNRSSILNTEFSCIEDLRVVPPLLLPPTPRQKKSSGSLKKSGDFPLTAFSKKAYRVKRRSRQKEGTAATSQDDVKAGERQKENKEKRRTFRTQSTWNPLFQSEVEDFTEFELVDAKIKPFIMKNKSKWIKEQPITIMQRTKPLGIASDEIGSQRERAPRKPPIKPIGSNEKVLKKKTDAANQPAANNDSANPIEKSVDDDSKEMITGFRRRRAKTPCQRSSRRRRKRASPSRTSKRQSSRRQSSRRTDSIEKLTSPSSPNQ